jgi:hypothetical protein
MLAAQSHTPPPPHQHQPSLQSQAAAGKRETLVTTPDRCAANTGAGKVVSRRIGVRPGSVCIIRWYAAGALCLAFCTVPAHAWLQCCENISRH